MSSVKSLLRKLINEEIDKLDEQADPAKFNCNEKSPASIAGDKIADLLSGWTTFRDLQGIKKALLSSTAVAQGAIVYLRKCKKIDVAQRVADTSAVNRKERETKAEVVAVLRKLKGRPAPAQTANFCANPDNDNKDVPGLKGFRCSGNRAVAQSAEAAKAAGAKAGGGGTGSGTGRRKKNTRVVRFQKLLNKLSSRTANRGLKPTRRAKDGADGDFGKDTLAVAKMHLAPYKKVAPYLKDVRTARRNTRKLTKFAQNLMKKAPQKKAAPAAGKGSDIAPAKVEAAAAREFRQIVASTKDSPLSDRNRKLTVLCAKYKKRFDATANKCV